MFRAIRHAVVLLGIVGLAGALAARAAVDSPSDPEPGTSKVEHSTIVPVPAGLTAQEILKLQTPPQVTAPPPGGAHSLDLLPRTKDPEVSTIEVRAAASPSPEDLAKLAASRSAVHPTPQPTAVTPAAAGPATPAAASASE